MQHNCTDLMLLISLPDEEHQYADIKVKEGNCHAGTPFTTVATYSGGERPAWTTLLQMQKHTSLVSCTRLLTMTTMSRPMSG